MDIANAQVGSGLTSYSNTVLEQIGDAARPRGHLPIRAADIRHIPGKGGVVETVRALVGATRQGNHYFRELADRNPPVFRGIFGAFPTVYVSDADLVAAILRNEDATWSTALAWRQFFSSVDPQPEKMTGLVFVDFDVHRDVRRVVQPAFAPQALSGYLDVAYPYFAGSVDAWTKRGTVDAKRELRAVLAGLAGRIFAGMTEDAECEALDSATASTWKTLFAISNNRWLDPAFRTALRGYREMLAIVEPRIAARKHAATPDLLGRVASSTESVPSWFDDDVRARLVVSILLAAFDTTSNGLASAIYLLAKHPAWQERLREEALSLGRRPLSLEETRSLELTDRFWKETLRLFPVAGGTPRRALRETELGGLRIPEGAVVMPMIGPLMIDPKHWTKPLEFDPDRFAPDRAEDRKHRAAYLPFGSGAHTCIGMQLAHAEAKAFLHALVTRCRIRLAPDYEGVHTFSTLGVVSGNVRITLEAI